MHVCIPDADLPVVPKLKDQYAIIEEAHYGKGLLTEVTDQKAAANISSHFGWDKTAPFISNSYFPDLYAKVAFVCQSCMVCQQANNGMSKLTKVGSVLNPVQVPAVKWKQVAIDMVGPLPADEDRNRHIIIVQDYFSKWLKCKVVPNKKAVTVAIFLVELVQRYGVPDIWISDRGKEFNSHLMIKLNCRMGACHCITWPRHPQANGMVERLNQTIENFLVKHEMKDTDWSKLIGSACFAYCTHMHKATGYMPARVFLGWDLIPPIVQAYKLKSLRKLHEQKVVDGAEDASENFNTDKVYLDETGEYKYSADEFMDLDYDDKLETIENLHAVIKEKAKENITKRQALYKKYYDKKHEDIPLKVGDWVFVCEVKSGQLTKKKNKWKGDYKVIGFPTPTMCSMRNRQGHKVNDALLTNVKRKYPGLTLKMLEDLSKTEDNTYDQEFVQATQPDQHLPEMLKETPDVTLTADIAPTPQLRTQVSSRSLSTSWTQGTSP